MGLKVALQMDPIGSVNIDGDSTFRIALEAQARGHTLFFYTPDKLAFDEGRVTARGWPIELRREKGNHVTYGAEAEVDLSTFDVVWLRQDPPFDMGYITTTHILERIHPGTLVVNDPFWVRNSPEKLLVLNYPHLTPPTMIARDLATIRAFMSSTRKSAGLALASSSERPTSPPTCAASPWRCAASSIWPGSSSSSSTGMS